MPVKWADTTNAHGRLIITVLAGLAEVERELIRSRCGEGIVRAKQRGLRFGRPPKLTPHQRVEARDIQDALRTPFSVRGRLLPVTVSIGVSIYPKDARSVTELFEHAACAVDVAKRAGKGCYRSFRGRTPVGLLGRAPSGD